MLNLNFYRCPFKKSWDNLLKNERKALNFRGWFMHRMFLMTMTVKNAFQKSPGKIQDWINAKQIQSLNNFVINQRLQQTSLLGVHYNRDQENGSWDAVIHGRRSYSEGCSFTSRTCPRDLFIFTAQRSVSHCSTLTTQREIIDRLLFLSLYSTVLFNRYDA